MMLCYDAPMPNYTTDELLAIPPQAVAKKYFIGNGLYLYVRPSGVRSWRFKYRLDGREQSKTLGRFPAVGLNEALRIAIEAKAQIKLQEIGASDVPLKTLVDDALAQGTQAAAVYETLDALHEQRIEHLLSSPAEDGVSVYIARAVGTAWVKIGMSRNVTERLRKIEECQPFDLELLATLPGGRLREGLMHATFKADHIRGEWFTCSDRINRLVERLNAQ